jgi:hypothetical protein
MNYYKLPIYERVHVFSVPTSVSRQKLERPFPRHALRPKRPVPNTTPWDILILWIRKSIYESGHVPPTMSSVRPRLHGNASDSVRREAPLHSNARRLHAGSPDGRQTK